ncbi:MAG TPA: TetR family transcriptional regulator, partial [Acidimicrobiales bacterium]
MVVIVKSRREEYAETTRAAIVAAAVARFTAQGFTRTSMDSIAEAARVTKGAVYHHFRDKAELFEAVFTLMEQRLLDKVTTGVAGMSDPWALMAKGIDLFLDECGEADFRRIALEEAPAALGWARWKETEERYFLGLVAGALAGLAEAGLVTIPPGDLTARMLLAATSEAGLAVASSAHPEEERVRVGALVMRLLEGLR